ncbi:MAG: ABC transporter permease subunit, partial [Tannerellaceae bacterium]|nr:ABC transporter permease subunit [Tannerellaceae bacterium]
MNRRKKWINLLSAGLILALWQGMAIGVGQPEFFPSVPRLAVAFGEMLASQSFYLSLGATLARGLAGMALSLLVAAALSVLFARVEWIYELFRPLLILMRSVPVISFILIALIFLHPEGIPLLIGFLTMFPLLVENLTEGTRNLNADLRTLGIRFRLSRQNKLAQLLYPQLKPFLFSGLTSAAGFGWRAIVMGEVLSQCAWGIGSEMKRAQSFIDVPALLAWTLAAVAIGFLSDKAIQWISERKIKISFPTVPVPLKAVKAACPIVAEDISCRYGVARFSYCFEENKIYGISAPSGTGKTTLLNLLGGTLLPVSGHLTIDPHWGIASVFEKPLLLPHLTVKENITLVLASSFTEETAGNMAVDLLS